MTEEIKQWLGEIRLLQQKLVAVTSERDQAYQGAANWRKLYETEAQQRRTEANLAKQEIVRLEAELQQLRSRPQTKQLTPAANDEIQLQVEACDSAAGLKQKLLEVLTECTQLKQALQMEQMEHAQTRQALTTALGDAIDQLKKERSMRKSEVAPQNAIGTQAQPQRLTPKIPSPELLPGDPVQFPV
jgi:uncharacterized coiled-coil DUF342 family protein